MPKEEIKYEISKVLDQFSDKALTQLLGFLKKIDNSKQFESISTSINKILAEDKELFDKLKK